ncbi:MAG TPA: hypothetical protein VHQ91_12670 [Geminicoccaceae bacterium]|nr:hypothetical protein [Geminicoccaceae bacterium]
MTGAPGPPINSETAGLAGPVVSEGFAGGFGLESFRRCRRPGMDAGAERAGTFAAGAVAKAHRTLQFRTGLGKIGFDQKGDITGFEPGAGTWQADGGYVPLK